MKKVYLALVMTFIVVLIGGLLINDWIYKAIYITLTYGGGLTVVCILFSKHLDKEK